MNMMKVFFFFFQWLTIPFAMANEATTNIGFNATTKWVKDLDPKYTGSYIDSYLLLIFGGIPWQVQCIVTLNVD